MAVSMKLLQHNSFMPLPEGLHKCDPVRRAALEAWVEGRHESPQSGFILIQTLAMDLCRIRNISRGHMMLCILTKKFELCCTAV